MANHAQPQPQCAALSDPKTLWQFCPSLPAAYLFCVLFGITTIAHFVQMIIHRKLYTLVVVISGGLQTAAYVFRVLSIKNPANSGYYSYWFILLMVAPIWTNAYAYMVMGRMVYNFTPTASVFKVKAWRFGLIFVLLDVLAFLVQLGGAAMASGTHVKRSQIMLGIHIYQGGIGFQQACIFLFLALAIRYHMKVRLLPKSDERKRAMILLYVEYVVVALITVRIIFRLVEYAQGFKSTIPLHEAYQYVLDTTLMFIALALYNVFHPGRLMPGTESNLPSRKVRKGWKKSGQAPQGRVGDNYLLPKYESSVDQVGKSVPENYAPAQGHYARLSTPSPDPSRPQSFDYERQGLQGGTSPPREGLYDGYAYQNQYRGPGS